MTTLTLTLIKLGTLNPGSLSQHLKKLKRKTTLIVLCSKAAPKHVDRDMQVCFLHTLFLEYATETKGNKCKAVFYRYKWIGMRSLELFWPFSILAKKLGDVLALSLSNNLMTQSTCVLCTGVYDVISMLSNALPGSFQRTCSFHILCKCGEAIIILMICDFSCFKAGMVFKQDFHISTVYFCNVDRVSVHCCFPTVLC